MRTLARKSLAWVLAVLLALSCCVIVGVPKDTVQAETSGDFTYWLREDGTICIANYTGQETDLIIPSVLDGYSVSEVYAVSAVWSTSSWSSLTSVVIPEGVRSIDGFSGCLDLENISIPDSVTYIASYSFRNSGYYNNPNNWQEGALYLDNWLIAVDETVSGTFTIREGTRGMQDMALGSYSGNDRITAVVIPNSMMYLEDDTLTTLWYLPNLCAINVQPGNEYFSSVDGVLFNKDQSELLRYPLRKEGSTYSIPNTVRRIDASAFADCSNLSHVIIANSVISIGDSAFYGCDSLTSVTIPDSVESIGEGAFSYSGLETINISDGVKEIGEQVFWNTPFSVNEANYKNNALYAGNHLIDVNLSSITGTYEILPGTVSIAARAFSAQNVDIDSSSVTGVIIPDSVHSIGYAAFYDCFNLTSAVLPDSITYIGESAFESCENYTFNLPPNVTYIGDGAFHFCGSTDVVEISDQVSYIGEGAFSSSFCLERIEVSPNNPYYCDVDGVLFTKDMSTLIAFPDEGAFTNYVVPEGVRMIDWSAFQQADYLVTITLPESVEWVNYYAFSFCPLLDKVIILNPDAVLGEGVLDGTNAALYGYTNSSTQIYANNNDILFMELQTPGLPFTDVAPSGVYYTEAVQYVYREGLMTGMNPTTFAPAENLSRAHFATILYRMAGSPSVAGMDNPFEDNQSGAFYYDAAIWCNNAGILTGYYNPDGSFTGRFGPSDNITREQLATMLYRYADYIGADTSARTSLDGFGDGSAVSSFAVEALEWAAAEGIVSGRATNPPTIAPQDNASRADTAVMIQRFLA